MSLRDTHPTFDRTRCLRNARTHYIRSAANAAQSPLALKLFLLLGLPTADEEPMLKEFHRQQLVGDHHKDHPVKLLPLLGLATADEEPMVKEFHRRQLVWDHHKDHRYCELQHRHQTKWQVNPLMSSKTLPAAGTSNCGGGAHGQGVPSLATCLGPPQGSSLLRASTSASNKMAACQLSLLAKVDLAFFWFRVSHLLHGTSFLQTVRFARAKECQVGDQTSCFPGSSYRNIKATIVTSFNSSIEILLENILHGSPTGLTLGFVPGGHTHMRNTRWPPCSCVGPYKSRSWCSSAVQEVDVPLGDENSTSYQDVWPSVASWHPLVVAGPQPAQPTVFVCTRRADICPPPCTSLLVLNGSSWLTSSTHASTCQSLHLEHSRDDPIGPPALAPW
ncbi:hypothetical protein MTO96_022682 [Rhipicephalus appendiculatus]